MTSAIINLEEISIRAQRILDEYAQDYRQVNQLICGRVHTALMERLTTVQSKSLTKDDVLLIKRVLVAGNNSSSYRTWLQWKTYNHLASMLNKQNLLRSPYIKIANRKRRFLVFQSEETVIRNIQYVQALFDNLVDMKPFEVPKNGGDNIIARETEYLCSFIAAAALFGKVLFNEYHLWLLTLRKSDVYFGPVNLVRSHPNSDAFQRYFLPFPASAYLMRCWLFYRKHGQKLGLTSRKTENNPELFPQQRLKPLLATIFRKWSAQKLASIGIRHPKGITIDEFRNAAKAASVVDHAERHSLHNSYPPFLISAQSDDVKCFAYKNTVYPIFFGMPPDRWDKEDDQDKAADKALSFHTKLEAMIAKVIARLTSVRRTIMKPGKQHIEDRRQVVADIETIIAEIDLPEAAADVHNIQLYADWLKHIILKGGQKPGTINTYASQIPRLLYVLSGFGRIDELSEVQLIDALSQTMYEYRSKGIRSALINFCKYLKKRLGGAFPKINWKLRRLRKQSIPTTKTFVPPHKLQGILLQIPDFYTKFLWDERNKEKRDQALRAKVHKAYMLTFMIQLAYYIGMRVGEIVNIRCHHFKYADGWYLAIRKSKTANGKRNLYLKALLPAALYKELTEYYIKRRDRAGNAAHLFHQRNGKPWKGPVISQEVARIFTTLGIRSFRFHHLRHAFLNIQMYRFLAAFHPDIVKNCPALIFQHELLQAPKLQEYKKLILGGSPLPIGKDLAPFAIQIHSRLMGHGGTLVTMREYFHTADIMFAIFAKQHDDQQIKVTARQAIDYFQLRHSQLPPELKTSVRRKQVTASTFVIYQEQALSLKRGESLSLPFWAVPLQDA